MAYCPKVQQIFLNPKVECPFWASTTNARLRNRTLTMVLWETLQTQTITYPQEKKINTLIEVCVFGTSVFWESPKGLEQARQMLYHEATLTSTKHFVFCIVCLGKRSNLCKDNELSGCVSLWDSYYYTHPPPKEIRKLNHLFSIGKMNMQTWPLNWTTNSNKQKDASGRKCPHYGREYLPIKLNTSKGHDLWKWHSGLLSTEYKERRTLKLQ